MDKNFGKWMKTAILIQHAVKMLKKICITLLKQADLSGQSV